MRLRWRRWRHRRLRRQAQDAIISNIRSRLWKVPDHPWQDIGWLQRKDADIEYLLSKLEGVSSHRG